MIIRVMGWALRIKIFWGYGGYGFKVPWVSVYNY